MLDMLSFEVKLILRVSSPLTFLRAEMNPYHLLKSGAFLFKFLFFCVRCYLKDSKPRQNIV